MQVATGQDTNRREGATDKKNQLSGVVKRFSPTCVLCCRAGASDKLLPVSAVVGYVSGEAKSSPARLVSVRLDRVCGVLNPWIYIQALAILPELVIPLRKRIRGAICSNPNHVEEFRGSLDSSAPADQVE